MHGLPLVAPRRPFSNTPFFVYLKRGDQRSIHLDHKPRHTCSPTNLHSFKQLPSMLQKMILSTHQNIIFAHEPAPPSTTATQLLTTNLCNHTLPNNLPFEEKTICWHRDLLLHHNVADDMTGFDNGILVAYGMCTPCELMEYYQLDPRIVPLGFLRGTRAEVWGDDTLEVI